MLNNPMKLKLIFFFILLIKISHAQNLVSNPDFETFTNCPMQVAELFQAEPWIAESTPDYFNRCAVFPTGSSFPQSAEVPVNYYGDQEPLSGDAYAGYAAGEYITGVLIEPLIAGECYYAEYYVNRAQPAFLASLEFDDFHTFFSKDIPEFPIPIESFQLSQINFSVNSEDWALISGSFIASGGEQYITINVRDDYHFVDDFKVIRMETDTQEVFLCNDDCYTFAGVEYCTEGNYETTVGGGSVGACEETIILKINSEPPGATISTPIEFDCADGSYLLKTDIGATIDMTYEWSNSVEVLSTDSQVFVDAPGRYYLKSFIGGCVSTDSIDLFVLDALELTASKSNDLDCNNSSVALSVSSATSDLSYSWTGPGTTGTGITIDITEPGEYVVTGMSTGGICSGVDTIVVEENLDDIEVMITKSSDLDCDNLTVTLEVTSTTSDLSYSWTGPGTTGTGTTIDITEPGEYVVTGISTSGICSGVDTIMVEENLDDNEVMITKSSDLDCDNFTVTLEVTSTTSDLSYSWTGPGTTGTGPMINVSEAGEYIVIGTNAGGFCSGADTIMVVENFDDIKIMIIKSGDLNCNNSEVVLQATSITSGVSYSWTGPDTNAVSDVLTITEPGEYTVMGINIENTCAGSATIVVADFIPIVLDYVVFQPNCIESEGSIVFNTELTENYQHSINGGVEYFDFNEFDGLSDGVYNIMIKDKDGCESEIEEVIINIYEPLSISLPDTIKSDFGVSMDLDPIINFDESIIASISWSPSVDIACDTCLNTTYNVNESLLITLEILTNDGCIVLGNTFIELNETDIYIPNVFSPLLRDGKNDYLIPYTKESGNPRIFSFVVYDRWGNKIFENQNARFNEENTGWDGTFKGNDVQSGVYVYYIIALSADGSTLRLSGDVSVL